MAPQGGVTFVASGFAAYLPGSVIPILICLEFDLPSTDFNRWSQLHSIQTFN